MFGFTERAAYLMPEILLLEYYLRLYNLAVPPIKLGLNPNIMRIYSLFTGHHKNKFHILNNLPKKIIKREVKRKRHINMDISISLFGYKQMCHV